MVNKRSGSSSGARLSSFRWIAAASGVFLFLAGAVACSADALLTQSGKGERIDPSHLPVYEPVAAARPRIGNALPVGKCINMGGMLEFVPEARHSSRVIRDFYFDVLREADFNTVRLPVKFSAYTEKQPPYRIDRRFLDRVHHVVDAAVASGLNVIVDLHHFRELEHDPDAESARFQAIWRQLSLEFASAPPSVWFELLNEPGDQFWNKRMPDEIFAPAIAEIRKTNPTRPIIVTGQYGGSLRTLPTIRYPENDPNVHGTFHFYAPQAFTHQGAGWTTIKHPVGRPLMLADRQEVEDARQVVSEYIEQTGRVPFLGEFGVIDLPEERAAERLEYYRMVSGAFASIGVQSCPWSFTNGFSFYKHGAWLPGALDALQTTTTVLPPPQD